MLIENTAVGQHGIVCGGSERYMINGLLFYGISFYFFTGCTDNIL
jgi:hypothetical protein